MRKIKNLVRAIGSGTYFFLFCFSLLGFLAPYLAADMFSFVQLFPAVVPFLLPIHLLVLLISRKRWKVISLMALIGIFTSLWVGGKDIGIFSMYKNNEELKVVSFNARNFNFTGENIDTVISIIKPHSPHVVCFQEFRNYRHKFDGRTRGNGSQGDGLPATDRIAQVLGMPYYHYMSSYTKDNKNYLQGIAIFSRFPIVGVDTLYQFAEEANNGMLVTIETPSGKMGIGNFHLNSFQMTSLDKTQNGFLSKMLRLGSNATKRIPLHQDRIERVMEKADAYPHPLILAADLNTVPHTRIASQLTRRFTDSFSKKGRGMGWTFMLAERIGVRIDYLLSSDDLTVTRHQVIRETKGVSDHFPILGCYRRVDGQ